MTEPSIWVIYDHPKDYPQAFIARRFVMDQPTREVISSNSLEWLRFYFEHSGLALVPRDSTDDPVIVETWM